MNHSERAILKKSLHAHMQASLNHLTLDESSGQVADIRWDIQTDNDPATHCMHHSEHSMLKTSLPQAGHLTLDEASGQAADIRWDI